jgi:16S rRNA (cytidine1402-2'-O)-methyltransferase
MLDNYGKLYVVATPIGNLADFSYRAVTILQQVDWIAAEDTRHIQALLQHYGIVNKKLVAFHQHNEEKAAAQLVEKLQQGQSIALVSDAGTPLLSDPGMPVVKLAKDSGITVVPIPGACAVIAALCASGLPTSRFCFEGFLPRTSAARQHFFTERLDWEMTWIFYESCHRILATLQDMAAVFPRDRPLVIAREITKLHETIVKDSLENLLALVAENENMRRGELVVIVAGATVDKQAMSLSQEHQRGLQLLLQSGCSIKTAVNVMVEMTGGRKKAFYQAALALNPASSADQPANDDNLL